MVTVTKTNFRFDLKSDDFVCVECRMLVVRVYFSELCDGVHCRQLLWFFVQILQLYQLKIMDTSVLIAMAASIR